jgi:hypothetical protein
MNFLPRAASSNEDISRCQCHKSFFLITDVAEIQARVNLSGKFFQASYTDLELNLIVKCSPHELAVALLSNFRLYRKILVSNTF